MTVARVWSQTMASLHIRAARGARHLLHLTGALTCLFAIFISGGGHWAVLQSIAYTRMVVEFAHQDSLCTALKKAFDERYACPLCPKIRDGYNKQHNSPSTLNEVHQLEFLAQSSDSVSFLPEIAADIAFVSPRHMDFLSAPPKPPPRIA